MFQHTTFFEVSLEFFITIPCIIMNINKQILTYVFEDTTIIGLS